MSDPTTVTILGCGTSRGVPALPEDWGLCDPKEPYNRRMRASILIQKGDTSIVIDTTPDFHQQALTAGLQHLTAVLLTHDHADHTHGLDDVRGYAYAKKSTIPVYMNDVTKDIITDRFSYAFEGKGGYPAICESRGITCNKQFKIKDITILAFEQIHGRIKSLGFRIGDFAYSTDLNALPESSFEALEGVKTWVVDALRPDPHPTHSHLSQTLEWIDRVGPEQAFLTHMTGDMDYQSLMKTLPKGIFPAFDGLKITI
ncbi:MBL fold metallo-hydrolase [Temperatibacter marinus]|uniref:MBL fold metallo-hydrolase n=1 Tax=Temperatibacter marinus TaxID=1456591 RepID=A0AA52EFP7_9PROT|nr:MBL fold metallo-hydrolase [Temperatibacter marinus]WND02253.1 MBL fold metallo-hydrolase [Temperatibacter marinus]